VGLWCPSALGQEPPKVTIESFQAFLFNVKSGALSSDILKDPRPALGNVPVGIYASNATLIVVKVHIGDAPTSRSLRVRLVAIESGRSPYAATKTAERDRVILDRSAKIGPANELGVTHIGFWLHDTGCREIRLRATLSGGASGGSKTEVIPFTCYE